MEAKSAPRSAPSGARSRRRRGVTHRNGIGRGVEPGRIELLIPERSARRLTRRFVKPRPSPRSAPISALISPSINSRATNATASLTKSSSRPSRTCQRHRQPSCSDLRPSWCSPSRRLQEQPTSSAPRWPTPLQGVVDLRDARYTTFYRHDHKVVSVFANQGARRHESPSARFRVARAKVGVF